MSKKKKPNGEGTIYKRKDGLWCATLSLGFNSDGTRKRKYIYGDTYDEVHKKLVNLKSKCNLNNGYLVNENVSLSEWGKTYLYDFIKPTVRPSTFQRQESVFRVHIEKSNLGKLRLIDIKPFHIQKFLNTKTYLVESSIKKIYQILNIFLRQAVLNNYIWKNPIEGVVIPKSEKRSRDIEILTKSEQKKYIVALDGEFQRLLFLTALFTGMRQGELIALKWNNVDLNKGIININESYKYVKLFDSYDEGHYEMISQQPKTKSGIRKIPIPEFLIKELKEHRIIRKEYGMKIAGSKFNPTSLVFCSETGTPLLSSRISRTHKRVCKNAGIEHVSFHALRHTFASRMLELGEDIKKVSVWLGHSTVQMTYDIYVHITKEEMTTGSEKMNDLFYSLK